LKYFQRRGNVWYVNGCQAVSKSQSIYDLIVCEDLKAKYMNIMSNSFLIMESYEEMEEHLFGCYAAFIRFYDSYLHDSQWVWVNKDCHSPVLDGIIGKFQWFLGRIEDDDYYELIKTELKTIPARSLICEEDWLIRFYDSLILSSY